MDEQTPSISSQSKNLYESPQRSLSLHSLSPSFLFLVKSIPISSNLAGPSLAPELQNIIMSNITNGILAQAERVSEFISRMRTPVQTDGAHPIPSLLTESIHDLEQIIQRGPALTLADLVCRATLLRSTVLNRINGKCLIYALTFACV